MNRLSTIRLSAIHLSAITGIVFAGFAVSATANAQILMEKNISMQMAMTAFQGAVDACKKTGSNNITVAIVDRAGQVALEARANNASPHNLDLARRKAYTARTFRSTSMAWRDRTAGNTPNAPQRQLAEVIALGGGVPIVVGDEGIGGIGVSGSNGGQKGDEDCAKAGLAAIQDQLR
jgi:uncharacterized protein GlcG (DUF336 family)